MGEMQQHEEALPLFARALDIRMKELGPSHVEVAGDLANYGRALLRASRPQEAAEQLRRALAVLELVHGAVHVDVARALTELGTALMRAGHKDAAEQHLRRALHLQDKLLEPPTDQLSTALVALAELCASNNQVHEAEALRNRWLSLFERVKSKAEVRDDPGHLQTAAWLYSEKGHLARAEQLYRRALSLEEKVKGPGGCILLVINLARVLQGQAKYREAKQCFLRALELQVHHHRNGSALEQAETLHDLGELARARGHHPEAEEYYDRALLIYEAQQEPADDIVSVLHHKASSLYAQERYGEAKEYFQRVQKLGTLNVKDVTADAIKEARFCLADFPEEVCKRPTVQLTPLDDSRLPRW
eukprot:CAMPEP_0114259420 /NCGR_PEP_ID=MMETSP0058-20121206/19883_1 /TAXON_ID=36894 /ORGANISM="Pyramimonas parkeae, CCMP726" /LENGTH=359 /DNA_ID=CAMNT_0001374465 /DNA_START=63 /DNA_END=1139 /DNA_ORIENTATION=+